MQVEAFIQPGVDFFPHDQASNSQFNRDNDNDAFRIHTVLKMTQRFGWRAIQDFAFRIETGIVTGAGKLAGFFIPVHGTGEVRTTTGKDKYVIGGLCLAQDVTAVVAGSPFPAVDFGNGKGEGMKLADQEYLPACRSQREFPVLSSRSAGAIKYPITGDPKSAPMMPPTNPVVAR